MMPKKRLYFAGTDGPVVFEGAENALDLLDDIFCKWPIEPVERDDEIPTLSIRWDKGKYRFSSDHYPLAKQHSDAVNAVCTLVAELAWSRIRHEPELLCFHGAAIESSGRLMLFPNQRRAGKSTLTACLAAQGFHVFTDDYLPLRLEEKGVFAGIANGAALRLRLPLPEDFSPTLTRWIQDHAGPRNRKYQYLGLEPGQLAPHGATLPISTIILLARSDEGAPRLEKVETRDVLRRVIYQNFSRSMNPARVLAMLSGLVETSDCYRLHYSNAEAAAAYLKTWCAETSQDAMAHVDPANLPPVRHAVFTTEAVTLGDGVYRRNPSAREARYGEDVFAACEEGPGMHAFNGITTGIWNLLAEPMSRSAITQILVGAFPEQSPEEIDEGVGSVMQAMLTHRLILPLCTD